MRKTGNDDAGETGHAPCWRECVRRSIECTVTESSHLFLRRRGAEEAGAVFIKISRLDGTAEVFAPAPQTAFDQARPSDRAFIRALKPEASTEADAEAYLARQIKFDPDIWIIEVEDRSGRNFLDSVVS